MAFYDLKTREIPEIEDILRSDILFKIYVMNYSVTSGRWPVLANVVLEPELKEEITFYKIDPITKECFLYENHIDNPASEEDCSGLEKAAVWDPEYVEDRLRDHYLRVPCIWL